MITFVKNFILGISMGLLLPCIAGYLFIVSGAMPVSTKSHPLPFEKFIARKALHAAMKGDIDKSSPLEANEANFLQGAKVYQNQCAICHGLPDQHKTHIAQGLFPSPPQLFDGDGVTDDPVGETYWKVKNGIRLTGMPGFEGSLAETEMWSVSLLLSNADKLSPSVKKTLAPLEKNK
jgi:thiosulfate dehydrogenase